MDLMVEYAVVDGMEAEADRVRSAFLDAVANWEPHKFTYRIMRRGPEGNSYVHLAWLDSPETQQRLFETDFFKAFNEGMEKISGGSVTATPLFEWSAS
ncbi:MAG: hypothetical protein OEM97_01165 [Acidimicrobiia bacterium]|nr:hypothetical protein [Acidimicrobiia bacterium]